VLTSILHRSLNLQCPVECPADRDNNDNEVCDEQGDSSVTELAGNNKKDETVTRVHQMEVLAKSQRR